MAHREWSGFPRLRRSGVAIATGLMAALWVLPTQAKDAQKERVKDLGAVVSRSAQVSGEKAARYESRPVVGSLAPYLKERLSPSLSTGPFGEKRTQGESTARYNQPGKMADDGAGAWGSRWQAAPPRNTDVPFGWARTTEAKPLPEPSTVPSAKSSGSLYGWMGRYTTGEKTASLPERVRTGTPTSPRVGGLSEVINPTQGTQKKGVQPPDSPAVRGRIGDGGETGYGLSDKEKKTSSKPYYRIYQPPLPTKAARDEEKPANRWSKVPASDKAGPAVADKDAKQPPVFSGESKPVEKPMGGTGQAKALPVKPGWPLGPEKDLASKVVTEPGMGQWIEKIHEQILQKNKGAGKGTWSLPAGGGAGLPGPSLIVKPDGEKVAPTVIDRGRRPPISTNFTTIRSHFGNPYFGCSFIPRPVSAFSIGYRLGFADGFSLGLHYGVPVYYDVQPVFMRFYFGYYFDDPFFAGFGYPGYYPSIYAYYGWLPRWCNAPGIALYAADPYPIYLGQPAYYYAAWTRLDEEGVERATADIRSAWLGGDIDRLAYYFREGKQISVYFDGKYSYSVSRDDYYTMTLDAMSTLKTVEMDFDEPIWLSSSEVFFTGRHIFYNPDNEREIVYVSYRLHRYGGHWSIIAVGSSPRPISHKYHDFRYWE